MDISELIKEVDNLRNLIVFIDDNLKFNITIFLNILVFSLGLSGWAMYSIIKNLFDKAIRKAENEFNQEIILLKDKIGNLQLEIKNKAHEIQAERGLWTPFLKTERNDDLNQIGRYYRIENIVFIKFSIVGNIDKKEEINVFGLPFSSFNTEDLELTIITDNKKSILAQAVIRQNFITININDENFNNISEIKGSFFYEI